jgi:FMN reductase
MVQGAAKMSRKLVVGLSGNLTRPSKTKAFVSHIAGEVASRAGAALSVFDIEDLGPSFPLAKKLDDLDAAARAIVDQLLAADVLVVGSPTFKGS